jgi:hypothetical protein
MRSEIWGIENDRYDNGFDNGYGDCYADDEDDE